MKIIGVIPARYKSSRFPGKPLAEICGKPMIWWVYQQARKCDKFTDVLVATDSKQIYEICLSFDMHVLMTSEKHDTPTSRIYEVSKIVDSDLYCVLMGDEPLFNAECLHLILPESKDIIPEYYVAALSNVLTNPAEVIDFSNQKVVTNADRNALMISRSPIPYPKGSLDITYEKVTGVQLFSKMALEFYHNKEKSALELAEENDLMRFVENGITVKIIVSPYKTISVDTPKDLEQVRCILAQNTSVWGGGNT